MAPEVFLGNLDLAHLPKPPESPILDDMESTGLGLWGRSCASWAHDPEEGEGQKPRGVSRHQATMKI